jgi:hypothetical protein
MRREEKRGRRKREEEQQWWRVESGEGKGGGERAKWGRRGRGWKRWHQPQLAVALLSKKRCCYGT